MEDRSWAGALIMGSAAIVGLAGLAALVASRSIPAGMPEIREGAVLSVDPAAIQRIDHRAIHEERFPDWVRAAESDQPLQWARLVHSVERDPNLEALVHRMGDLVAAGPVQHADELEAVVQTWNDVMASAGVAYRLECEVAGGRWWLKSYEDVLTDAEVDVDGSTFGVTVRRRVDAAAPADAWLGQLHGPDDRVVVLLDRVTSFTLDRIWPLLDPVMDQQLDLRAAQFGPSVRAEVREALPAASVQALRDTAEDRYWLLRATDTIHRRSSCSGFRIVGLPWSGLSAGDRGLLYERARATRDAECPEVTEVEALAFDVRSRRIRSREGVETALEQLIAFVARVVVAHEARHAYDIAAQQRGEGLRCRACDPPLSPIALWEGSAYLTTFAQPEFGSLALFQACDIDPESRPVRAEVVRYLAGGLGGADCSIGPPRDLPARASALESELFGRASRIELRGFPSRLPVTSLYGSR